MWFSPWRRILRGRSGDAKPSGLRAGTKFVEEDTGVEYTYDPVMKDWKKRTAPYSALVAKDGSTVWAEDASGKTIASGESGVDDASVIQSALDVGGKIVISKGNFICDDTILIPTNTILCGFGKSTVITYTGNDALFRIENGNYCEIADILCKSEGAGTCIKIGAATYNSQIRNVRIENFYDGVVLDGSDQKGWQIDLYDVKVYDCEDEGIVVKYYDAINLVNCYAINCGKNGLLLDHTHDILILSGNYERCEEYDLHIFASDDIVLDGVIRFYDDTKTRTGIYIYASNNIRIRGILAWNYDVAIKIASGITTPTHSITITQSKLINNNYAIYKIKNDADLSDVYIHDNDFTSSSVYTLGYSKFRNNKNYITENSGTATFSGDGTTTDFEIGAHGLVTTDPSKIAVKVTPASSDAIAASPCVGYVDPADNTKIRVKFSSAPASGSENVKIVWYAEVVS